MTHADCRTEIAASATRFWSHVSTAGDCWEWQGARVRGYGLFNVRNRTRRAHRVAWELTFGPIPDGLYVCHRCDNPPCVRPQHLFLGTQGDNLADMSAKGRTDGRGTRLTPNDVMDIDRLFASGASYGAIGKRYGLDMYTIRDIVKRRHFKYVPIAATRPNVGEHHFRRTEGKVPAAKVWVPDEVAEVVLHTPGEASQPTPSATANQGSLPI